jgi:hypothetical protein
MDANMLERCEEVRHVQLGPRSEKLRRYEGHCKQEFLGGWKDERRNGGDVGFERPGSNGDEIHGEIHPYVSLVILFLIDALV